MKKNLKKKYNIKDFKKNKYNYQLANNIKLKSNNIKNQLINIYIKYFLKKKYN